LLSGCRIRPRGALVDPAADDLDLIVGKRRAAGRHARAEVGADHAVIQTAPVGVARTDVGFRPAAHRIGAPIEPQAAHLLFGTMTPDAARLENRLHVALKIDAGRALCRRRRGARGQRHGKDAVSHAGIVELRVPRPEQNRADDADGHRADAGPPLRLRRRAVLQHVHPSAEPVEVAVEAPARLGYRVFEVSRSFIHVDVSFTDSVVFGSVRMRWARRRPAINAIPPAMARMPPTSRKPAQLGQWKSAAAPSATNTRRKQTPTPSTTAPPAIAPPADSHALASSRISARASATSSRNSSRASSITRPSRLVVDSWFSYAMPRPSHDPCQT